MPSRRIFEFVCKNGHRSEEYTYYTVPEIECPECKQTATRVISPCRSSLEGVSGDFPTAYDAWTRKHEQAARVARQRKLSQEGPDA